MPPVVEIIIRVVAVVPTALLLVSYIWFALQMSMVIDAHNGMLFKNRNLRMLGLGHLAFQVVALPIFLAIVAYPWFVARLLEVLP